MRSSPARRQQLGFSLLELLVTIVIVGILASLATASYRGYGIRANRSEGTTALLSIQVAEEKFYLQNGTYTANIVAASPAGLGLLATSAPSGYYTLTVVPNAATTGTIATSYAATATAVGSQTADTAACRTLSIDETGSRTPTTASGCWK